MGPFLRHDWALLPPCPVSGGSVVVCASSGYGVTSNQLEIRSVERGICPIATSTMNELFL